MSNHSSRVVEADKTMADAEPEVTEALFEDAKADLLQLQMKIVALQGAIGGLCEEKKNSTGMEKKKLPFRFPDLPAELRNRVYAFALVDGKVNPSISKFVLPPVTRASKQLRTESLPLFFSENSFQITVFSNFVQRKETRDFFATQASGVHGPIPSQAKGPMGRAGRLNIKAPVKKIISKAGNSALFREVTFHVISTDQFTAAQKSDRPVPYSTAHLSLSVDGRSGVLASWESGALHPDKRWFAAYAKQDVDEALDGAIKVAYDIAERAEFRGFSLRDLERIGNAFRFQIGMRA
ncbi:Hypothetical predicted protein [Lecanosticta acicola]|uniref:Uncharacterized protein n=1 Tax=Lecanosticta acicola TaxID=111012 RepID=A0AAI8W0L2_9PEZI|nr:Hypothetical predicted protein [Lecanosticta acicola]